MNVKETVKLDITIEISTSSEVDTGYTVDEWNDLDDAERSRIAQQFWDIEASNHDSGGMSVITEGAEEL